MGNAEWGMGNSFATTFQQRSPPVISTACCAFRVPFSAFPIPRSPFPIWFHDRPFCQQAVLDVHDVTVAYHRKPVLWDIDLTLDEPSLVGIIGPNRAGKSTLIKAILGLVPLASGSVSVLGQPIDKQRRLIGYVPQRESVDWDFPVDVLDVVLMGTYGQLGWFRRPGLRQRQWARQCLEHVGLADLAHRQIGQLSGGQQQAHISGPGPGSKGRNLFHGRADGGRRCRHGTGHFRSAARIACTRQDRARGSPRPAHRAAILRARGAVEYAAGRGRPDRTTFTPDNLHKTYGGRLPILDAAGEALRAKERSA